MLSEMDNHLLHLALLTVGAYSLVVGAVPLTVPLYVDRSYVRSVSSVVFIIDTTHCAIGCQVRWGRRTLCRTISDGEQDGRMEVPYNLTDGQWDLLRKLVQEVRAGNLPEEFSVLWVSDSPIGIFAEYEGEHPPPVTQGALDALAHADLILSKPYFRQHGESSRQCTLLGSAYTAVDSEFDNRMPQYAESRSSHQRPLAFISHDSRDKADIALPLALMLEERNCPVWYADFSLRVGDSLRESIERGLKETRKCILLLSPNFLRLYPRTSP